jgi:formate/nitrite transporter FocA (FNT family)
MERIEVARRASPRAVVVLEAVHEEGRRELVRSPSALAISGMATGLSMGFSLVAEGPLHFLRFYDAYADRQHYWRGHLVAILNFGLVVAELIVFRNEQEKIAKSASQRCLGM